LVVVENGMAEMARLRLASVRSIGLLSGFRPVSSLMAILLISYALSAGSALASEVEQILAQELEKAVLAGVSGATAAVRIGDRTVSTTLAMPRAQASGAWIRIRCSILPP
jgi:hypothetical protein